MDSVCFSIILEHLCLIQNLSCRTHAIGHVHDHRIGIATILDTDSHHSRRTGIGIDLCTDLDHRVETHIDFDTGRHHDHRIEIATTLDTDPHQDLRTEIGIDLHTNPSTDPPLRPEITVAFSPDHQV